VVFILPSNGLIVTFPNQWPVNRPFFRSGFRLPKKQGAMGVFDDPWLPMGNKTPYGSVMDRLFFSLFSEKGNV
jgi:hypothetical protein